MPRRRPRREERSRVSEWSGGEHPPVAGDPGPLEAPRQLSCELSRSRPRRARSRAVRGRRQGRPHSRLRVGPSWYGRLRAGRQPPPSASRRQSSRPRPLRGLAWHSLQTLWRSWLLLRQRAPRCVGPRVAGAVCRRRSGEAPPAQLTHRSLHPAEPATRRLLLCSQRERPRARVLLSRPLGLSACFLLKRPSPRALERAGLSARRRRSSP